MHKNAKQAEIWAEPALHQFITAVGLGERTLVVSSRDVVVDVIGR